MQRPFAITAVFLFTAAPVGLSNAQSSIEVISWVPPYAIAQTQAAASADFGACDAADGLTRVGLQFWTPNSDGSIKYANHEWYTPTDADVTWWKNWCAANDVECLLTIYNNTGSWDWNLARSAFDDNRSTFVNALISELDRLELDGIDLDLEGIGSFDSDRAAFDQFVHELWLELDARGKILTIDSFHYIWNAPNHNWWSDWLGEVDNIHSMGYEDLYEGGSGYQPYSYQQNAGFAAGYGGRTVSMGMPSRLASWGASSGRGTSAQAHVQEVRYDLAEPTGIAIWDLQLSLWQDADLWCEIKALKESGGDPPPTAPTNLAAATFSNSRIDLTWTDNASNEDGFRVERSPTGAGSWTQVAALGADATSFADNGLTAGTGYDYRVFAHNANGESGSGVATASTFTIPRTIQFSGRSWTVKASDSQVGPGPNYFSDKGPDVWVDESGRLHMRIVYRDDKWYSTEVITDDVLGYGKYTFVIEGRVDQLDENVVLGLFTWDSFSPEHNYREIDIEFAKWGNAADPTNSQYVVQPYLNPENMVRFTTALESDFSTHLFDWQPGRVDFASHQGAGSPLGSEIYTWSNTGPDIPPEGTTSGNARINLWLFQGQPPVDGQELELIVAAFDHEASSDPVVDHVASGQSVRYGTVSGGVSDTHSDGGGVEIVIEEESNGNPRRRHSRLEKTWEFPVRSGLPATFFANTWHPGASDGDAFLFSYSTDNASFSPMFEVSAAGDDGSYQSHDLGPIAGGTVWIRVEDTDRTEGNRALDQLFADHLFIRTVASTDPPGETEMHLGSLSADVSVKRRWKSSVTVGVHGPGHAVESGVTVAGVWSEGVGNTCTTGSDGTCTVARRWLHPDSVTFTVTDMTKAGLTYAPSTNDVLDAITIHKDGQVAKMSVGAAAPGHLTLKANYPNPFNPSTVIEFGVPAAQHVRVSVFDALGREVALLYDGNAGPGWYRAVFDGTGLSSGAYVVAVRSQSGVRSNVVLLSK